MASVPGPAFLAVVLSVSACGASPSRAPSATELVLLTRGGCSTTATMRTHLDGALRTMGLPLTYQVLDLASLPASDSRLGYPTPTLLYANRDLFGMPEPTPPFPEPT